MLDDTQTVEVGRAHMHHRCNQLTQTVFPGKNSGRVPKYLPEFIEEGVKGILLRKRCTQPKSMGVSKTTVHHWIVESTLCVHSNSLRPILTEENRLARFKMAMGAHDPVEQTKYQDMCDQIHVDEKWFFLMREKERYLLHRDEENPKCCVKHKLHINRKCTKTLSKAPCLVALNMYLTLHLLLFRQSM